MASNPSDWGFGEGADEGGGYSVPIIPSDSGHLYSPANPYELRMPTYANEKPCDYVPLHVPHYWDLAQDYKYCLGLGKLENINEH